MARCCDVYFYGQLAGKLIQDDFGKLSFNYLDSYLQSNEAKPLSVVLPLGSSPYADPKVRAYFSGLLPDDVQRHNLAWCLGVSEKNPFALLEIIGGECAGAIMLYPEGTKPHLSTAQLDTEMLDEEKLVAIFATLSKKPMLAGEKDIRLSLAGAQNKLAVGVHHDKVVLIKCDAPTTHILKPPIMGINDSVHNEYFCMQLAYEMRLPVATVSFRRAKELPYLLIQRYDRISHDEGEVLRIHQEDFCQALGIAPEFKYENEGGAGFIQSVQLIRQYSSQPARDLMSLIRIMIFNFLIGNADAHGKNFSLLYHPDGIRLAPFYDLMSTQVYPALTKKMAMKIGGKYLFDSVYWRHWEKLALEIDISPKLLHKEVKEFCLRLPLQAEMLADKLNQTDAVSPVYQQIIHIIRHQINQFV